MYGGRTMAQVQPLNIPTTSKLTEAREFLCEAVILVSDVKSLFFNSGVNARVISGHRGGEISGHCCLR